MRVCDLDDEPGIIPLPQRLPRRSIDRPVSFWTGDGNRQISFSGCAVNVRVSGNKKSFCDRRTESFDDRRMRPGPGESIFVNVGGFHRAEHDQHHRANENDEEYHHAQAAEWNEPFPVSLPPVWSRCRRNWWRYLLHRAFLLATRGFLQPISLLRSKLDGFSYRHAACRP